HPAAARHLAVALRRRRAHLSHPSRGGAATRLLRGPGPQHRVQGAAPAAGTPTDTVGGAAPRRRAAGRLGAVPGHHRARIEPQAVVAWLYGPRDAPTVLVGPWPSPDADGVPLPVARRVAFTPVSPRLPGAIYDLTGTMVVD